MINPRLRILLIDEKHSRRLSIEKILASLGYSCVAPLSSLDELLQVIDYAFNDFDLLIINEASLKGAKQESEYAIRNCRYIKNFLIYQCNELNLIDTANISPVSSCFVLPCLPDRGVIRNILNLVDRGSVHSPAVTHTTPETLLAAPNVVSD
ncbi:histidine kinase [Pseudomonas siliginis]|uniref:histidine kinase n=1 Tax=Pseudomonas siliginis TaxID=2842346 RepID=UPI002093D5AA|nr:histidine kinase [Pseudomonas siliginis]UST72278.1 histidine kinase [Pseudomonas siliginis]